MAWFRHRVSGPGSAGDLWVSTMHSSSAAALSTVHAAWSALITGFIGSTLGAMWPNETSATSVTTDQLDVNGLHNVAQLQSSIASVGTGAGGTVSPRSCIVIGLRTVVPTKAGRGRMFWPAPDSGHFTPSGNLNSTDAATLSAAFAARLTTFKATSQPIILHRGYDTHTEGGIVFPQKPSTADNVTTVSVGVVLGTQRRRTNRVANAYTFTGV